MNDVVKTNSVKNHESKMKIQNRSRENTDLQNKLEVGSDVIKK